MLRSIFSLIQNIIDSDKEYNNRKSNTVIYLVSTPDNTLNMDLEIDGKPRQNLKAIRDEENGDSGSSFKITTEQGDMVTCKHFTDKKIIPKSGTKREDEKLHEEYRENVENSGERIVFSNNEEVIGDREVIGEDAKKYEWDETKVHDLLAKIPKKHTKVLEKDKDQMTALMDQIQKMKTGMERLQEIAQHFNTSERFKKDVEYLTKTVGPALKKSESEGTNLEPKSL